MFGKVFLMDCRRSFQPKKIIMITLILLGVILVSEADYIRMSWNWSDATTWGALDFLSNFLHIDRYKIILAFILAALYTSSFCEDDNSHYLRMILSRTDITTYTQSRFLANFVTILSVSIIVFYVFVFILLLKFPLVPQIDPINGVKNEYYDVVFYQAPFLYVLMAAVQFGMFVAACSSISLLFSAYNSNALVSVGLTGMLFYMALSYLPVNTPFRVLELSYLDSPCDIFNSFHKGVTYAWGLLYPTLVIFLSAYLFDRRMKRRMENGNI